jgi:hypothetical protein
VAATSSTTNVANECSVCHERFETSTALMHHRHLVHGESE